MYLKLRFLVVQKLNSLKLLGVQPPDPLLQISTIKSGPLPRMSSLTSTNIIVTKLTRPNTGITDKT